ncbi:MAG TPA: hypothetical protein DCF65_07855 [Chloroflexi bacterium]|jgi:hypothetical protein|nr:hypothetical protein [Chloroflexota bacterium]HAF20012.1 hypothetical protein [Chloroflexota bacterium]
MPPAVSRGGKLIGVKLTFKITNLSASGSSVQVALGISSDDQTLSGPQPAQINVFVPEALGNELELGETFEMEIKADKP